MTIQQRSQRLMPVVVLLSVAVPWTIGARSTREATDRIEITTALPPDTQPTVLFHGWRNETCHRFEVLDALELADLGTASELGTPDCQSWIVAFAPGYSPTALLPPLSWAERLDAPGKRLEVTLAPAVQVFIKMWVVRHDDTDGLTDAELRTFAQGALINAQSVLHNGMTGVDLTNAGVTTLLSLADERALEIGTGCASVDRLRATQVSAYEPGHLNVYFVEEIRHPSVAKGVKRGMKTTFGELGRNCAFFGAPEIMYINYTHMGPGTLAHEIGHALGFFEPNGGHTDHVGGLKQTDNVMDDGSTNANGTLSLGQAFRLRFDTRSWLNRRDGGTSPVILTTCQVTMTFEWPCPHLRTTAGGVQ